MAEWLKPKYRSVFVIAFLWGTQSLLAGRAALLYSGRWPLLGQGCFKATSAEPSLLDPQATWPLSVGRSDPQRKEETGKASLQNPPIHSLHRQPPADPCPLGGDRSLRPAPSSPVLLTHPSLHGYMKEAAYGPSLHVVLGSTERIKHNPFFSRSTQFSGVASAIPEGNLWKQPRRAAQPTGEAGKAHYMQGRLIH